MASELKITQEHQKYLEILGIKARNGDMITLDNVTKAYKKQALNAHPDKGGSAQKFTDLKDALEKMQQAFNPVENHGHGINAWWHAPNTHRSRFGANFWAEVDPKSTETKKQEQHAEPVLNKSPVWKQFLLDILNALIFIVTFGISYLVTGRLRLFSAEPQVAQTHGVNSVKPGLSPAS